MQYILFYRIICLYFFFNDTATTEIYTLSLHDALPISVGGLEHRGAGGVGAVVADDLVAVGTDRLCLADDVEVAAGVERSEEHTSELQSRQYLVCRLLLEKKKKQQIHPYTYTKLYSTVT